MRSSQGSWTTIVVLWRMGCGSQYRVVVLVHSGTVGPHIGTGRTGTSQPTTCMHACTHAFALIARPPPAPKWRPEASARARARARNALTHTISHPPPPARTHLATNAHGIARLGDGGRAELNFVAIECGKSPAAADEGLLEADLPGHEQVIT